MKTFRSSYVACFLILFFLDCNIHVYIYIYIYIYVTPSVAYYHDTGI